MDADVSGNVSTNAEGTADCPPKCIIKDGIMVIGCEVSDDEISCLKLPPGYQLLQAMNDEQIEMELATFASTFRWEKRRILEEDLGEEEPILTPEDQEEMEIDEDDMVA